MEIGDWGVLHLPQSSWSASQVPIQPQ